MISRRALLRLLAAGAVLGPWTPGCGARRRPRAGGPYLLDARPDQVTVALVTAAPTRLTLRWTPEGPGAPGEAEGPGPATLHRLPATGLVAGASYRYEVVDAQGNPLGGGRLRAAPSTGRVTFVALGDSGGTSTSRGALVDAADAQLERARGTAHDEDQQARVVGSLLLAGPPPDLLLHTGDVVYPEGARADYAEAFFSPFAPLIAQVPTYAAVGNHDIKSEGGTPFDDHLGLPGLPGHGVGRTRSFDYGPLHVVLVDAFGEDSLAPGGETLAWLEEDLRRSEATWKVALVHVPPFGPSRHGDSDSLQAGLVPALERAGVDLLLSGHDHVYARYFPVRGVTYLVTGGGGQSLYEVRADARLAYAESVFHHVRGEVDGRSLHLSAVDATGRRFDACTLTK